MKKIVIIISVVIVVVAAGVGGYLLNKPTPKAVTTANTATDTSVQVATCKSGTSQTVANAGYLVGTDITAGSYKVVSQPTSAGWTNVDVYGSKDDYTKSQDPNNKQAVIDNSFTVDNQLDTASTAAPSYTKLTDGQYMVIGADPATFTCQ